MPVISPGMSLTLNELNSFALPIVNYNPNWAQQQRDGDGPDAGQWVASGGGHRGHVGVKGKRGGSAPKDPRKAHIVQGMADRGVHITSPDIDAIERGEIQAPEGYHEVARTAPVSLAQVSAPPRQYQSRQTQPSGYQRQNAPPSALGMTDSDLKARLAYAKQSDNPETRVRAKSAEALLKSSDPELQAVGKRRIANLPKPAPEQIERVRQEAEDPFVNAPPRREGESFTDHAFRAFIYAVEALDKPGRAVRGVLGGKPREIGNVIPFSDYLGITSAEDQVSGRDILQQLDLAGPNTEGFDWGDVGGLVVEAFTDPLMWFGGIGAVGKAGKTTQFTAKSFAKARPKTVAKISESAKIVGTNKYRAMRRAGVTKASAKRAATIAAKKHTEEETAKAIARANSAGRRAKPVNVPITKGVSTKAAKVVAEAHATNMKKAVASAGMRANPAAAATWLLNLAQKSPIGGEMIKRARKYVAQKLGVATKTVRDATVPGLKKPKTVGQIAAKVEKKVIGPNVKKGRTKLRTIAKYLNEAHIAGSTFLEGAGVRKERKGKVTENTLASFKPQQLLQSITANFSGSTRRERWQGREYIVAPLSLIVEGVLNGSKGPLHYPMSEIKHNYTAWNNTPIVVYHPTDNMGRPVRAQGNAEVLAKSIGVVRNSQIKHPKLVAEGWFDLEKTKQIDPRVYNALMKNEKIELSTGLHTDNEPANNGAHWNGRSYTHVARNYRPDHLAILPDQIGACSINDGCGVLVNAEAPVTINGWIRRATTLAGAGGGATLGGIAGAVIGGGAGYLAGGAQGAKDGAMIGGALGGAAGVVRGGGEGLATGTALESGFKLGKKLKKKLKKKPPLSATLSTNERSSMLPLSVFDQYTENGGPGEFRTAAAGGISGAVLGAKMGGVKGALLGAATGTVGGYALDKGAQTAVKAVMKRRKKKKAVPTSNILGIKDYGIEESSGRIRSAIQTPRKLVGKLIRKALKKNLNKNINAVRTGTDLVGSVVNASEKDNIVGGIIGGGIAGAGRGALLGTAAAPGAGTLAGTISGAAIGAVTGGISGYIAPKAVRTYKKYRKMAKAKKAKIKMTAPPPVSNGIAGELLWEGSGHIRGMAKQSYEKGTALSVAPPPIRNEWSDAARAASLEVRRRKAAAQFQSEGNISHVPRHHEMMAQQHRRQAMIARRGGIFRGPDEDKASFHDEVADLHEVKSVDPMYHAKEVRYHEQIASEGRELAERGAGSYAAKAGRTARGSIAGGILGVTGGAVAGHVGGKVIGGAVGGALARSTIGMVSGIAGGTVGGLAGGPVGAALGAAGGAALGRAAGAAFSRVGGAIGSRVSGKAVGKALGKAAAATTAQGTVAGKATGKVLGGIASKLSGKTAGKTAGKAAAKGAGKVAGKAAASATGKTAGKAAAKGTKQTVAKAVDPPPIQQGIGRTVGQSLGATIGGVSGAGVGGIYGAATGGSIGYESAKRKSRKRYEAVARIADDAVEYHKQYQS